MLNKSSILETKELIQPYIINPPLQESIDLSDENRKVYFKNEGLQYTKSFKLRGALSKILRLTEAQKKRGVVAVSSGNHGIAVSYVCQLLNIKNALIFVPKNTPKSKTEKIKHFGAKLIIEGKSYDEAHEIGMAYVKTHNMVYVDAYDNDPVVYSGQGTIGVEILESNSDIDTILVPIGGGGLITGIATYIKSVKPEVKIIGIQTEACPAMKASIDEQILYAEYPSKPSLCEALIGGIGRLAYQNQSLIDDILLVKESTIKKAIQHMLLKEKMIAEPSSCVPIAALMDHPDYPFGKNIALVISGNNIDENLMIDLLLEAKKT